MVGWARERCLYTLRDAKCEIGGKKSVRNAKWRQNSERNAKCVMRNAKCEMRNAKREMRNAKCEILLRLIGAAKCEMAFIKDI